MTLETLKLEKPLQDEVLALCQEIEMSPDEAAARIAELEKSDFLEAYPSAQRKLHAVKIFRAEANARLASGAQQYAFRILATSPPERGQKKEVKGQPREKFYIPGRNLAVGYPLQKDGTPDGPIGLVNIAFFEDHADKREKFEVGKSYIGRLTTSNDVDNNKPVYQCSVDNSFSMRPADEVKMPENFNEWLKNIIHHVPVNEVDKPEHHSEEYELRLVIGTVAWGNLRSTKIGPMATLEVFDDSVKSTKENAKRMSVRVPVSEFKYGTGSEIVAIGPLKKRQGKSRAGDVKEYITLNANFVFLQNNGLLVPRKAPIVEASASATPATDEDEEEVDVSDFK